jgi:hypothetical protein
MTKTRIYIDIEKSQVQITKIFQGNNPNVIRDGFRYCEKTYTNHGFENIESYLLNSSPTATIEYCEL